MKLNETARAGADAAPAAAAAAEEDGSPGLKLGIVRLGRAGGKVGGRN